MFGIWPQFKSCQPFNLSRCLKPDFTLLKILRLLSWSFGFGLLCSFWQRCFKWYFSKQSLKSSQIFPPTKIIMRRIREQEVSTAVSIKNPDYRIFLLYQYTCNLFWHFVLLIHSCLWVYHLEHSVIGRDVVYSWCSRIVWRPKKALLTLLTMATAYWLVFYTNTVGKHPTIIKGMR